MTQRGIIAAYRDRLPVSDATPVVSLLEGGTPLIPATRLSEAVDRDVYLKYDGANPTGSFKDRGMTMAVSKALEAGARLLLVPRPETHLHRRRHTLPKRASRALWFCPRGRLLAASLPKQWLTEQPSFP